MWKAFLLFLALPAFSASVSVNGVVTQCVATPSVNIDPAGNISVICPQAAVVTPSCSATNAKTSLSGNYGTDTPTVSRGGFVSYKLPIYSDANIPAQMIGSRVFPGVLAMNFTGVNNNADGQTSPRWGAQFTIAACPGDFTGVPNCTRWGVPDNGGIQLPVYPQTAIAATGNNCTVAFGVQYYLNIRFVNSDKVTPSCQNGTCTLIVNFNSSAKL